MSTQTFNYIFNINGNSTSVVPELTNNVNQLNEKLKTSTGLFESLGGKLLAFTQFSQLVENVAGAVQKINAPGAALNANLQDLSAISGETGESLKLVERYARESAKTFGGSAAQSVESYKLLLGQLSPELAKAPKALKEMGDNVAVLSKTMEGNATAATEVLTTAMNQYGVSLENPLEASRKMAEMMNVMAAAGKEGSAELPTIKQALEQCGMASKAAGVSFEETNSAIQILDKAGKKGSEGGVALRNVMNTLAKGRFLPKEVQKELRGAGVDVNTLTDKSKSLTERLRPLQGIMNDTALLTKLFGTANTNAALALIQGVDAIDECTVAITGTNTAFEQADIIMEGYNERLSRINAKFDDFKISIFNATNDFGIWVQVVFNALVPISQLVPLITILGNGIKAVSTLNFAGILSGIGRAATVARYQLLFLNHELRTGQMVSIGFLGNVLRATLGLVQFATVGLFNGIKALGAYVLSLVTGGTASATFSAIATASFTAFKVAAVSACRAVSIAIKSIPVIGWIIAVIAAIGALFAYFWNTSAKFRGAIKGLGAAFVEVFKGIWNTAKNVFSAIGDLVVAAFSLDTDGIKAAIKKMSGGFAELGSNVGKAFTDAYNKEIENSKEPEDDTPDLGFNIPPADVPDTPEGGVISVGLSGMGVTSDKSDKIKNINVTIDRLIDKFEIHTSSVSEDKHKIKDMVAEALLGAVNDLNYAL